MSIALLPSIAIAVAIMAAIGVVIWAPKSTRPRHLLEAQGVSARRCQRVTRDPSTPAAEPRLHLPAAELALGGGVDEVLSIHGTRGRHTGRRRLACMRARDLAAA